MKLANMLDFFILSVFAVASLSVNTQPIESSRKISSFYKSNLVFKRYHNYKGIKIRQKLWDSKILSKYVNKILNYKIHLKNNEQR